MKTSTVVFIAFIFLVIGILASAWYIKSKNVCYNLPKHGSTDEWGPKYWWALHDIFRRVPCSLCRNEGEELGRFIHDYVNEKTEKPIFFPDNYTKWLNKFTEIKKKRDGEIQ